MAHASDDEHDPSIDSFLREAAKVESIESEPDRVGQQLSRYRIIETIGRGGMGIVYEAEDTELGRRVALKVLPRDAVADGERRRRFLREARAAAALSHPNIVSVHDVGVADDTVFLAMERVAGTTLRAKLDEARDARRAGLPPDVAVRIATDIAHGLAEAHARGIVHRDLKPENVMIDASGRAKIVDFGLAKMAPKEKRDESSDLSTQDGRILGTPSYMAPEQAKGQRVTPAADVFSLGVVLYEMLTGSRPFDGASVVDVLVAVARDVPAPPSRRARGTSRELDRLVLRCLAKDPSERFADGAALVDALTHVPSRTTRSSSILAVAIAAVVLVTGGAVALTSRPSSPPVVHATPDPSLSASVTPMAATPTPSETPSETTSASPPMPAPTSTLSAASSTRPRPRASASASPRASATASTAAPSVSIDPLARQR